jgi:uncharacterized protein Yka (UPF0111/DUF47 family)
MFNFKPKEDKFYTMFSDSASNVNEAAKILRANLDNLSNKEEDVKKTEALEEKDDELVRDVITELNEAFITPIEREDIYSIIKQMNKILDLINSSMHRFIMFDIQESSDDSRLMGDLLVQATEELIKLMAELNLKGLKSKGIQEIIRTINKIEHKGDKIFRKTVSELFKNESDPLTVMKWKEIYQILEDTLDTCQRVAILVEGVVLKNA